MSGGTAPPVVLTIAGSDNSCGAGVQADLKAITALGAYAQTAVTCVVAEVPGCVETMQPIRAGVVAAQVRLSLEAFPVAAVKTGMLYSSSILRAVVAELQAGGRTLPLVVDPVMVSTSGTPMLGRSAISDYKKLLFPIATVVTPNLDELRVLSGRSCETLRQIRAAGREMVDRFGCAFLLKGGHLTGRMAVDTLVTPEGEYEFCARFCRGRKTHGTGCTYSAAIAAGLAGGRALPEAVSQAKEFITQAIRESHSWGTISALASGQILPRC